MDDDYGASRRIEIDGEIEKLERAITREKNEFQLRRAAATKKIGRRVLESTW